jgi:hypothetical protein
LQARSSRLDQLGLETQVPGSTQQFVATDIVAGLQAHLVSQGPWVGRYLMKSCYRAKGLQRGSWR